MASDHTGEHGEPVVEEDCELASPGGEEGELDPLQKLLQGREDHLTQKVDNLKKDREALTKQKKELTQKLKTAEKKKKRLKTKAKELSSADIVDVIVMRANEKALLSQKKKNNPEGKSPRVKK